MSKTNINVKVLTYSAICMALAFILSNIKYSLPFDGSATLMSMLFVVLIGYWFGPMVGIVAGFAYGLLQLIMGSTIIHPMQMLLDYPLAFGALGLSGFFRNMDLRIAYLISITGRFIFSSLSGYIFFAMYTPEGWSPIVYTIVYNGSYIYGEGLLTIIMLSLPVFKNAIIKVKNNF